MGMLLTLSYYHLNYFGERMLIEKLLSDAANNDDFVEDEFLDFLDHFKCRAKVSNENVHEVIDNIARQEVMQKPHLMVPCWQNVFTSLGKTKAFINISSLNNLYRQLEPTTEKFITLLKSDPKDDSERDAFTYFKRFIQELPQSDLGKLVKFITGSNLLLTVLSTGVTFIKYENEFSRRPIAHICLPSLELPAAYNNFWALRVKFTNIVRQNNWEMSFI